MFCKHYYNRTFKNGLRLRILTLNVHELSKYINYNAVKHRCNLVRKVAYEAIGNGIKLLEKWSSKNSLTCILICFTMVENKTETTY